MANLYYNKITLDKKALSATRNDFNQAICLLFNESDDYNIDFHENIDIPLILKQRATNKNELLLNPDSNLKFAVNEYFDNRIGKLKPRDFFERYLKDNHHPVSFKTSADFIAALKQICLSTDDLSMEDLLIHNVDNVKRLNILPFDTAVSIITNDFKRLCEQETGHQDLYSFEKSHIGCSNSAEVFGVKDNDDEFVVDFYTRNGAPTHWVQDLYAKLKAKSTLDLTSQLIVTYQFYDPQLGSNAKTCYQGDSVTTTELTASEINSLMGYH